jgi:hypothetical protein
MKSILDFENSKKTNSSPKKEISYSSISINQVLSQLDILLNENDELDGIFFLKNRSALMQENQIGHLTNFKGGKLYEEQLLNQSVKYSDFPRWKNIAKNDDIAEIDVFSNSSEPFTFDEDKSFLISTVREDKYNWGLLVAFAPQGKVWTKNQLKLMKSFSKLLCSTLHYFHQQKKETFLVQNSLAKENKRNLIIERLEKRLEDKNQIIDKLKKDRSNNTVSASFNWSNEMENENFDEVWVTVHGYKNGEMEPSVSKWEKVTDKTLLQKVSKLFFSSDKKQAIAG